MRITLLNLYIHHILIEEVTPIIVLPVSITFIRSIPPPWTGCSGPSDCYTTPVPASSTCLCTTCNDSASPIMYLQLVLRFLGEEGAQNMEVGSILAEENAEELYLLWRPYFWFLFVVEGSAAGYRVCLATSFDGLGLGFFLHGLQNTENSMESMMLPMVTVLSDM